MSEPDVVAEAITEVRMHEWSPSRALDNARVLADEVDRLKACLLKANDYALAMENK